MKNIDKKITILITGARAPIALELSRSFAAKGYRIIMADSQQLTLARWSNTIHKYIQLPSPAYHTEAFINELVRIIKDENITHLIPTCEEAFYISKHRPKLACCVWSPEYGLMNRLHNKAAFIEMAKDFFAVPKTILATEFSDWKNSTHYVFKKIYSRFATSVIIGKDETQCNVVKKNPVDWIAQELISGKEVCVYSIWDEGKMKAYACYHPLYRFGKGAGIYFQPVDNGLIFNQVKAFGQHNNYHGQLCFDVIIRENVPYVIECNPRGTSGAHLLNEGLCNAFFEDELVTALFNKEYCIRYAMWLKHPLALMKKEIRRGRDVIFSRKDMLPFFFQSLSLLEIGYIKFRTGKTWLQATTSDIEWNGADETTDN